MCSAHLTIATAASQSSRRCWHGPPAARAPERASVPPIRWATIRRPSIYVNRLGADRCHTERTVIAPGLSQAVCNGHCRAARPAAIVPMGAAPFRRSLGIQTAGPSPTGSNRCPNVEVEKVGPSPAGDQEPQAAQGVSRHPGPRLNVGTSPVLQPTWMDSMLISHTGTWPAGSEVAV